MKRLALLCFFLLITGICYATTYYFSVSGSTSNNGTSPSTPWPLSKTSVAFLPDDQLLFKQGDVFSGSITFNSSGTAGHPIVFNLYGGSGHNPTFDGASGNVSGITVNANYISISNLYLKNYRSPNGIIYLTAGHHDITLTNVALNGGIRGINAYHQGAGGVANIVIKNCWSYNIFDNIGGNGNLANGGGSDVQLNNCNGSGIEIAYNKFTSLPPSGANNNNFGVGDKISVYQSNGTAASNIWVHDNQIRGGSNNQVTGYIGITLGDVGGSYQLVENNTMCSPGQGAFGIMPSGGTFLIARLNRAYGAPTTNTHNQVGMGYNNAAGLANCTMTNNNLTWYVYGKSSPYNKYAFQGPPPGWATNTGDNVIDAAANDAMLPNPLFNEYDWDVAVSVPIIAYNPATQVYTTGTAITAWSPSNTGAVATSWSISPSLPAGLSFNTSTGVITGTPTVVSAAANYTVTANSTGGSGNTVINVQTRAVVIPAPNIAYNPSSATTTVGVAITTLSPSNTGGAVTTWGISPALPAGLTFNNGVISGIPLVTLASTPYTVSAANTSGTSNATVTLQVNAQPPQIPAFTYPSTNYVLNQNTSITISATSTGGVGTFSITAGSLPSGITLSALDGTLQGSPTSLQAPTPVTITCTNGTGAAHVTLTFAVNAQPSNHYYLFNGTFFGPVFQ